MASDDAFTAEAADQSDQQGFTVTPQWRGRAVVLAVSGEVDMVTAPRFQKELFAALEAKPDTLVADLTDVGFFDSAGLSALVAAYQQADNRVNVRVVAASGATVRPLRVTALDRKIPVYGSRDEALAG